MQMLWHDDVCVDRYHPVVGGDSRQQLVLNGLADGCQGDGGAVGIGTYDGAEGLPQAVCHTYGDVVDTGARVVVSDCPAAHAVLCRSSVFHSLFRRANRLMLFYFTASFLMNLPSVVWTM